MDARYDSKVLIKRAVLDKPRIYLERKPSEKPDYCGWCVGDVENRDPVGRNDLDSIYVYQLCTLRNALLEVLALPPGYLVVFRVERIGAVSDPK